VGASVGTPPPAPRRPGRPIAAIVIVVVLLAAAAVAGYARFRAHEPKTPAQTLTSFVGAASAGDLAAICNLLAASNLEVFDDQGTTCEDGFAQILARVAQPRSDDDAVAAMFAASPGGRAPNVHVLAEHIDGDRAEVVVRIGDRPDDPEGPVVLVREDGTWKLDLDAAPPS